MALYGFTSNPSDALLPLGEDIGFICDHGSSFGQERMTNPFLTGGM